MAAVQLERIVSSAVQDKRLDVIINHLSTKESINFTAVLGMRFKTEGEDPSAFCLGFQISGFPIGLIFVSDELYNSLGNEELEFVIAHEIGHIMLNHCVISSALSFVKEVFIYLLSNMLECSRKKAEDFFGIIKLILVLISKQKTIEEEITAQKELEADEYAVCLQKEKNAALSALTKLAGGNTHIFTHVTEDGKFKFPVLTFEDRIKHIKNITIDASF